MKDLSETSEIIRPLANFQPDVWGDRFLNYTPPDEVTRRQKEQEVEALKEIVRKELLHVGKDSKQILVFVDDIHRLGVAYHFESEIEKILQNIHKKLDDDACYEDDLHYVSLRFRLLRQHGFYVSSGVFERFKSKDGGFKEHLASDVQGLLNLYEASHVRVHGECTLNAALAFSTSHLTIAAQVSSPSSKRIAHALELPLHKRSIRLESKHHISFYESQSFHDVTLLRFAKLDFNLLQILHNMELRDLSRWSRSLDLIAKLPFLRERVVEAYFWLLGVYHEPKYRYARMLLNKFFRMISIVDDTYDAYGTTEELISFTKAIQRWEKGCIEQLPSYMRVIYQVILDTFEEIEQDLALEGRSYAISYLKQQMKDVCQAYLQEAIWRQKRIIPTYDDYMKNGITTSGYLYVITSTYQGIGELATKDAFEWIQTSNATRASCILARLLNDIGSHEFEKSRGDHVASAIDCYMDQFCTSKEEAIKELMSHMEEAWKDINEEMLRSITVPKSLLTQVVNLTRTLYDIYKVDEDGYTETKYMKDKVTSILNDPVVV